MNEHIMGSIKKFHMLKSTKKVESLGFLLLIAIVITNVHSHYPDFDYDRRNAYDYNVWNFLHWNYSNTWMMSAQSTYLNPIINIPAYLIGRLPAVFTYLFALSIVFLVMYISVKILEELHPQSFFGLPSVKYTTMLLTAFSPHFVAELGIMMSGWITVPFCLGGVLFALRGINGNSRSFVYSGLCCSLAANFKLVTLASSAATLLGVLLLSSNRSSSIARLLFGQFLGFLPFIPWYVFTYIQTKSPLFPFWNSIFKSPLFPYVNWRDNRWNLDSFNKFLQVISGYWYKIDTEIMAFDPRWSLCWASLAIIVIRLNTGKITSVNLRETFSTKKANFFVLTWMIIYFCIWAKTWFIARYFMPAEVLLGVVFIILIELAHIQLSKLKSFVLVTLVAFAMVVPNWNTWQLLSPIRISTSKSSSIDTHWKVPSNFSSRAPEILTFGEPLSYLIEYFPRDTKFVNLSWYGSMPAKIVSQVQAFGSENDVLTSFNPKSAEFSSINTTLSRFRIRVESSCQGFQSSSDIFYLCHTYKLSS